MPATDEKRLSERLDARWVFFVWFGFIGSAACVVRDSDRIHILDRVPPYHMNISILSYILF